MSLGLTFGVALSFNPATFKSSFGHYWKQWFLTVEAQGDHRHSRISWFSTPASLFSPSCFSERWNLATCRALSSIQRFDSRILYIAPVLPTLNLWLFFSPKLTWRDVQHVIVETSQITSPLDEGWKINGAGKRYNRKFGFGRLDVSKMVNKALKWNNVDKQRICHGAAHTASRFVLKLPWCNF